MESEFIIIASTQDAMLTALLEVQVFSFLSCASDTIPYIIPWVYDLLYSSLLNIQWMELIATFIQDPKCVSGSWSLEESS